MSDSTHFTARRVTLWIGLILVVLIVVVGAVLLSGFPARNPQAATSTPELASVSSTLEVGTPTPRPVPPVTAVPAIPLQGFEEADFPMPEDAVVTGSTKSHRALVSGFSIEQVVSFYDEVIPQQGWTKDFPQSYVYGGVVNLVYHKGDITLRLAINEVEVLHVAQILATVRK